MFEHLNLLSIDLETYGLTADAIILQIACAFIDDEGNEKLFHTPVSIKDQQNKGRIATLATLDWWAKQKPEVKEAVLTPAEAADAPTLREALVALTTWLNTAGKGFKLHPFGNGASFDLAMLNHAYASEGLSPPWHFRMERDQRTLEALAQAGGLDLRYDADKRDGNHHDASSDALYQARRIRRLWDELTLKLCR